MLENIQTLNGNDLANANGGEYDPKEKIYGPSKICTCSRCGAQWKTYARLPVKHVCSEVKPIG